MCAMPKTAHLIKIPSGGLYLDVIWSHPTGRDSLEGRKSPALCRRVMLRLLSWSCYDVTSTRTKEIDGWMMDQRTFKHFYEMNYKLNCLIFWSPNVNQNFHLLITQLNPTSTDVQYMNICFNLQCAGQNNVIKINHIVLTLFKYTF